MLTWQLLHLYSDYYANKLCRFRRVFQKLVGTVLVFVPPGTISLRGYAYWLALIHSNCISGVQS